MTIPFRRSILALLAVAVFAAIGWALFRHRDDSLATWRGHTGVVRSLAHSHDGRSIASAADDGHIVVWDAVTGTKRHVISAHSKTIRSVAFSPDDRALASASDDGDVKIWDVETGTETVAFHDHTKAAECVAFSGDGRYLMSGGADKLVRIWNVADRKLLQSLKATRSTFMRYWPRRRATVSRPDVAMARSNCGNCRVAARSVA